jgi:hypothetical protein
LRIALTGNAQDFIVLLAVIGDTVNPEHLGMMSIMAVFQAA